MGFYEEISIYYDDIFPTGQSQIEFLISEAENATQILDVACGTGGYSIALCKKGYEVTSIDLDADMIQKLKNKANEMTLRINAIKGNMLELGAIKSQFDLSFCIGNSLVHLESKTEIKKFLAEMRKCLSKNGKLVIQIINYDRIINHNVRFLPTIINNNIPLSFERFYNYDAINHKIIFKTILRVDGRSMENEILLYPLMSFELWDMLIDSGFKNIRYYGDFNKTVYNDDDSYILVVVAEN